MGLGSSLTTCMSVHTLQYRKHMNVFSEEPRLSKAGLRCPSHLQPIPTSAPAPPIALHGPAHAPPCSRVSSRPCGSLAHLASSGIHLPQPSLEIGSPGRLSLSLFVADIW